MNTSKKILENTHAIAEESLKTRRAREKLKKKLEEVDSLITPQALKEKSIEIRRWIERHSSERAVLKSKSISLFDENQNTAIVSKKITEIAEQLKGDLSRTSSFAESAKELLLSLSKAGQVISSD